MIIHQIREQLALFEPERRNIAENGQRALGFATHPDSRLIVGDARRVLEAFPDGYFHAAITSPPYFGLRDYGIEGQIGAETEMPAYLADLVAVFEQVRRTLRDDGTLWLNIGDGYTSGNRTWRATDRKNPAREMSYRPPTPAGLKPKDLLGVPWRLAFALQDAGWYLRSDIIWHKLNCQPESVRDRPTRAHEYLFLLTKSERYHYDADAVAEPTKDGKGMRNRRTVWEIPTEPLSESHFAVFPPALVRPCVLASTRPGERLLDPFFGAGTVGVVANELGRSFVGIELKPEYAEIAARRTGLSDSRIVCATLVPVFA